MTTKESPFACDMTAIVANQRESHIATIKKVFGSVRNVQELPNGYQFELPNDAELLNSVSNFISLERLCCPFFGFAVEIEPEGGQMFLSLTGRDGVKPFILAEIGEHLSGKP